MTDFPKPVPASLRLRRALALPLYAASLILDYASAALGQLAAWVAGDDWPDSPLPSLRSPLVRFGGRALECVRAGCCKRIRGPFPSRRGTRSPAPKENPALESFKGRGPWGLRRGKRRDVIPARSDLGET